MNRLVAFADPRHVAARVLLPGLLDALRGRDDIRCAGVFVPRLEPRWRRMLRWRWERWRRRVQVAVGSGRWERALDLSPLALEAGTGQDGVPFLQLADGDPNANDVLHWIDKEAQKAVAINLYCVRQFRSPLLSRFEMAVNYHNGRLPAFRGLRATNWSLYAGERQSGYCFHHMDAGLDSGPVICTGEVSTSPRDTPADVELRKAQAAVALLPDVLNALCRRDPGQPQTGMACSHNRRAFELATRVPDPSTLSRKEWERRLRAFLRVSTHLNARRWAVTRIIPCSPQARRSFETADGQWVQIQCADFWPASLVRARRDDA